MEKIRIKRANDRRIEVMLPYYNRSNISKIKSIKGYKWHPEGKYQKMNSRKKA